MQSSIWKYLFLYIIVLSFFISFTSKVYATLPGAHSSTVSGDVFLGGDYIELGISQYGSFGTDQNKPAGFYGTAARNQIGMSSDLDGFNTGTDWRMDFFMPGTQEERWSIGYKIGGSSTTAANARRNSTTQITNNTVTNQSSGDLLQARSVGSYGSNLQITQVISFNKGDKFFKNVVTLENISGSNTLDNVRYMRSFDPDNTVDKGGSYTTRNAILYTFAHSDGKAVVQADTSNTDADPVYTGTGGASGGTRSPILFYSNDSRARVGYHSSLTPGNVYTAAVYDSVPSQGSAENRDGAISITVDVGTLNVGSTSTFIYYTSLDNRDFAEVIADIEEEISATPTPAATATPTPTPSNANPNTPGGLGPTAKVNGSASATTQPALAFSVSDNDGADTLKYTIQISTNADFSSPVVEYTGVLGPQGTRSFTVGQAAGSGTYTTGSAGQTLSNGNYYWRVKAIDNHNAESTFATANSGAVAFIINTNTPGLSSISSATTTNSATVTWTTDEQTSSLIEYGLVPSYGFTTSEIDTSPRVTSHSVTIPDLKQCARYFYRVKSKNNAGTETISSPLTFTTGGCVASTIERGSEANIDETSGGTVELINDTSRATLTVPTNFADDAASFQLNKIENNNLPPSPTEKTVAGNNVYDLIAVKSDNTQITTFNQPITFQIIYGSELESTYREDTLNIYTYADGAWQQVTCSHDMGSNTFICTLNHFSMYVLFGIPLSSSGSNTSSSTSSGGSCSNSKPESTPDLFQIDTTETTAKLYFTPIMHTTQYYISYSENTSAEEHGALVSLGSDGVQSYTVEKLIPNKTYYFKVRGQNGCTPGDWSTIRSAYSGVLPVAIIPSVSISPIAKNPTAKPIARLTQKPKDKTSNTSPPQKPTAKPQEKKVIAKKSINTCTYTVKPGDSLWSISEEVYKDGKKFTQLVEQNSKTYGAIAQTINPGWKLQYTCDHVPKDVAKKKNGDGYLLAIRVEHDGQPVKNARIELHSKPRYGVTDDKGIVRFEDVEKGNHTLKIAYNAFKAEQKITVEGDEKEKNITINVELKQNFMPMGILISIICILLGIILLLLLKLKKKEHTH